MIRQSRATSPLASERSLITVFYLLFAVMFLAGIILKAVDIDSYLIDEVGSRGLHAALPPLPTRSDFDSEAVRVVTSTAALNATISTGRCVLFVNCDWNVEMVAFRRPFSQFAEWAEANASLKTISVKLDAHDQGKLWNAIQALWEANDISPGGMKTLGGAGRVVWFNDGRVVDHAWCFEVSEIDELRARTARAFP